MNQTPRSWKKKADGLRDRKFLIIYTILFGVSALLAFHYFPETGKRMIWRGDGLTQHYVALRYYARWGRAVLRSFLSGKPAVPTFNLHIGYGADLYTTFQYYVIGDPFSLPAVFVPQRWLLAFHDAMILLRLYLAGICFDRFCCRMGHRDVTGNLCGAVVYVFGNYTLFGMRHPYFLNALIWFPLLLIGAESILRGGRGRLFTAAVFLACISNFYFFYMLVFMTVLYAVWRALQICLFPVLFPGEKRAGVEKTKKTRLRGGTAWPEKAPLHLSGGGRSIREAWKGIGALALRFLSRGLLGTAMGMGFFLPVVLRFLGDPRTSDAPVVPALYPTEFYQGFAQAFLSFGTWKTLEYWTCMGYGALGLLGVLILFLQSGKEYRSLKAVWCVMFAMAMIPAAGSVLNGFSYPANRWIWAFGLLTAYITAVMVPRIGRLPVGRFVLLLLLLGLYPALCRVGTIPPATVLEIVLAAAAAVLLYLLHLLPRAQIRRALCSVVMVGTVLATVAVHGYVCFVIGSRSSNMDQYTTDAYVAAIVASDAAGVRQYADEAGVKGFFRYSGRGLANNYSVLQNVSNTQYFWSLSDGGIVRFFTETGQANESIHIYDDLDNRTMLDEIAGVRYYIHSDGSLLPYGYRKAEGYKYDNRSLFPEESTEPLPAVVFSVYENSYALPLGFSTDRVIARSDWEKLSIPERQEALMQGVVLEDEEMERALSGPGAWTTELSFTEKDLQAQFLPEEGIEIRQPQSGGVQVTVLDEDAAIRLGKEDLAGTAGCETSVLFTEMSYEALSGTEADRAMEIHREKNEREIAEGKPPTPLHYPAANEPVMIRVKAKQGGETVSSKTVNYTLEDNPWRTGRENFLSCCGYSDEPLEKLTLKFSRTGIYTFNDLKVVAQPMEEYPARAEAFRTCVLEDVDLHEQEGSGATSRITGRIAVPEEAVNQDGYRILCLQIPHVKGLQAYVDGKKTPLLRADTMFCALALDAGTHEIELRYHTPGLLAGWMISILAALGMLLYMVKKAANGGHGTQI